MVPYSGGGSGWVGARVYLVAVGRVAEHGWACWGSQVLRGWGRGRGCFSARGAGRIRGRRLLQAAGAGEESPPPHRPHHLVQESPIEISHPFNIPSIINEL